MARFSFFLFLGCFLYSREIDLFRSCAADFLFSTRQYTFDHLRSSDERVGWFLETRLEAGYVMPCLGLEASMPQRHADTIVSARFRGNGQVRWRAPVELLLTIWGFGEDGLHIGQIIQ